MTLRIPGTYACPVPKVPRYGLRLLAVALAAYALAAEANDLPAAAGPADVLYDLAFGAGVLWLALLFWVSGSARRPSALRARRRLGWTASGLAVVLTLVAVTLTLSNFMSGVPAPEVVRPLGLMLCGGVLLLSLGRWTLRRSQGDEDTLHTPPGETAG
jgi:peptidoglycan/LPS O-acetylase OafA/YrhL